jgi:hypothetical protein
MTGATVDWWSFANTQFSPNQCPCPQCKPSTNHTKILH